MELSTKAKKYSEEIEAILLKAKVLESDEPISPEEMQVLNQEADRVPFLLNCLEAQMNLDSLMNLDYLTQTNFLPDTSTEFPVRSV